MATEYTDVDRLLFARWQDVGELIDARDELFERVRDVIDEVGDRLSRWLEEREYEMRPEPAKPSYYVARPSWYYRRRDDYCVYFDIGAFAPFGYGKVKDDHPYAWLFTDQLEFLRMKESERVDFARALRLELGDAAKDWAHPETQDQEAPLGRYFTDIRDGDRVELIADPDKLFHFATRTCEELFTLSEPIDRVLAKFRPKE